MLRKLFLLTLFGCVVGLSSCRSFDSLVEVARIRESKNDRGKASDLSVKYTVTDLDVLNFTNGVKNHLDRRSSIHTNLRYGSATTVATLGGLAGAAKTFGWSTGTASALGLGATYVFGLGQIFNSKSHSQAYEQCLADVQAAEASYFFYRMGGTFKGGKVESRPKASGDIPSATELTYEGEVLYYRVTKVLNVLYDSLAGKIPDLQDLKEARGEGTLAQGAPMPLAVPAAVDISPVVTNPPAPRSTNASPSSMAEVLKPRNERLETAFKNMDEEAVRAKLAGDGTFIPADSTVKQHVAKLILAKADLPHPSGMDALQSLTFYREQANTQELLTKLEECYRAYHVLPAAQ